VSAGNLELARTTVEDERLDRVADALERMHELIEDLLAMARSGRTADEVRPVDLRSVAERAWATADTGAARLRIDGDPGTVRADESRLTQVFENLFPNSVEHGSTNNRRAERAGDSVEHGSTDSRPEADAAEASFRRERGANGDAAVTVTVGRTDRGSTSRMTVPVSPTRSATRCSRRGIPPPTTGRGSASTSSSPSRRRTAGASP
jgi:signal transduction histidine kinase